MGAVRSVSCDIAHVFRVGSVLHIHRSCRTSHSGRAIGSTAGDLYDLCDLYDLYALYDMYALYDIHDLYDLYYLGHDLSKVCKVVCHSSPHQRTTVTPGTSRSGSSSACLRFRDTLRIPRASWQSGRETLPWPRAHSFRTSGDGGARR